MSKQRAPDIGVRVRIEPGRPVLLTGCLISSLALGFLPVLVSGSGQTPVASCLPSASLLVYVHNGPLQAGPAAETQSQRATWSRVCHGMFTVHGAGTETTSILLTGPKHCAHSACPLMGSLQAYRELSQLTRQKLAVRWVRRKRRVLGRPSP